jgi:hypothetical protein
MTASRAPFILVFTCAALAVSLSCTREGPRTFASPEDAVKALVVAARQETIDELLTLFGTDAQPLLESSDPVTARRNRDVFVVAMAEGWRLADDEAGRKTLIAGNEQWPFPVPIVRDGGSWRFDTAAGRDEVLGRRIGRNELAVIRICRTYVAAQRLYARDGHDGLPAGIYARTFGSDPGRQNGLYWPVARGEKRSPLGDLVAEAASEGRPLDSNRKPPAPFHGYYFAILTGQGAAAAGGAKTYLANGHMTDGFALVAWPAQYDVTGIMTFVVNQEGVVREKDMGPESEAVARSMTLYDPDGSWATAN